MRTLRVLVVDDFEGMRALLGEVLGFYGYEVLTAASVPEAEIIRRRVGCAGLDLVIADLRLTHLPRAREGYDLIRRWQAVTPQLPCILMGGDLRPEDVRPLPSRGVWCLAKPFATAALLTTIREALRYTPEALPTMAQRGGRSPPIDGSDEQLGHRQEDFLAQQMAGVGQAQRPAVAVSD